MEIVYEIIEKNEKVSPLSILFPADVHRVKVLEKTSILIGEIPYELIEQAKYMFNIHTNSMKKKSSRPSMEGPVSRKDFLK